jgi:hypothetical protein
VDEEELAARLEHAKKMTRSLRNHAKDVSAYLTDFEEWLETQTDSLSQGGPGTNGNEDARVIAD